MCIYQPIILHWANDGSITSFMFADSTMTSLYLTFCISASVTCQFCNVSALSGSQSLKEWPQPVTHPILLLLLGYFTYFPETS